MSRKRSIAVVYFSGYGHTRRLAEAVRDGGNAVEGVEARLYDVEQLDDADWAEIDRADGIIFGAPTYMGSAAAKFKTFMEASGSRWYARSWKDKLAAGFTCSASQSGDKLNTLMQMTLLACQHGMLWLGLDLLAGHNSSQGSADDLNRLGCYLGVMAQANADEPASAMRESDLKTAERLGERMAERLSGGQESDHGDQEALGAKTA